MARKEGFRAKKREDANSGSDIFWLFSITVYHHHSKFCFIYHGDCQADYLAYSPRQPSKRQFGGTRKTFAVPVICGSCATNGDIVYNMVMVGDGDGDGDGDRPCLP